MIDKVITDIKHLRENIDHEFDHWYELARKMVVAIRGQESKPRTTKCFSTYRDNIPSDDIKDYWRRTTAVSIMDNLIAQLKGRLGNCQHTDLLVVLPSFMLECNIGVYEKKLEEIGIFYPSYYFCIKLTLQDKRFSQSTFYQIQYAGIAVVVRFFLN